MVKAGVAMAKIQQLYRCERATKALSAGERQRIRQECALPLLEDIRSWLDENLPIVPPRAAAEPAPNATRTNCSHFPGYYGKPRSIHYR
jgi:hypothetical protein